MNGTYGAGLGFGLHVFDDDGLSDDSWDDINENNKGATCWLGAFLTQIALGSPKRL